MNAYFIGTALGALAATFLLSRLLLRFLKSWQGGAARLLVSHLVSVTLACVVAAFGFGQDGALNWSNSGFYLAAQLVWLVVDLLAQRGRAVRP